MLSVCCANHSVGMCARADWFFQSVSLPHPVDYRRTNKKIIEAHLVFISSPLSICSFFFCCDSSVSWLLLVPLSSWHIHLSVYTNGYIVLFFLLPILHSNETATCKISILKQLNESHVNNTGFDRQDNKCYCCWQISRIVCFLFVGAEVSLWTRRDYRKAKFIVFYRKWDIKSIYRTFRLIIAIYIQPTELSVSFSFNFITNDDVSLILTTKE